MIIACKCIHRVVLHRMSQESLSATVPQPTITVQHSSNSKQPHESTALYKAFQETLPGEEPSTKQYLTVENTYCLYLK